MHVQRASRIFGVFTSLFLLLAVAVPGALAITAQDFPLSRPPSHVLDSADVLSRVTRSQLEGRLEELSDNRIDARLVTLRKLDYGLSLSNFGRSLIDQWSSTRVDVDEPLLIILIDAQTKQTAVLSDKSLNTKLSESLLQSVGNTTMSKPVVQGDRYQQASFDALERLKAVLDKGVDPGPPIESISVIKQTNIPTQEETRNSNATLWVVVLMVVGTIVPMATWWVFSQ